jgi:hypothetical protein
MTRRELEVFVLVSIVLACTESPSHLPVGPVIRDSAGVRIVGNSAATWTVPWRIAEAPSLTIGSIDGDSTHELYDVTGALRLDDGRVVVANHGTRELRFYDRLGTYMGSAGGRGGGPGEFESLEWIARFGPDSILVLDVWAHRVSYFDTAGRFGRSVQLEPSAEILLPRPVGFFADGSLLATHGLYHLGGELPIRSEREEDELFRYRPDGASATVVGSFPGPERDIVSLSGPGGAPRVERRARLFGRATGFAAAGHRFYVADNATYEIRVYSTDPIQLMLLIRKEHTPLVVTDADARAMRDSLLASRSGPARRMMQRSFENRPPLPPVMPAYAPDIHLDPDLNLWVREYTRPGERHVSWSIF